MSAENSMVSIIDDDPDIISLFNEALVSVELQYLRLDLLALQHLYINEYAYVLVIPDFKIPGPNGLEFLRR